LEAFINFEDFESKLFKGRQIDKIYALFLHKYIANDLNFLKK